MRRKKHKETTTKTSQRTNGVLFIFLSVLGLSALGLVTVTKYDTYNQDTLKHAHTLRRSTTETPNVRTEITADVEKGEEGLGNGTAAITSTSVPRPTRIISAPAAAPTVATTTNVASDYSNLAPAYLVFLDTKGTTSKHGVSPDVIVQQWNKQDTSHYKDLPFRYTRIGGWRECRKACDDAENTTGNTTGRPCVAFKFEIGHQSCFLLDGTHYRLFGSLTSEWSELKPKWTQHTNQFLDDSRKKGRFKHHQHVWGVRKPSATLTSEDQAKLEAVCADLGGTSCRKTDEAALDSVIVRGNLINQVFLSNVFQGVNVISKLRDSKSRPMHVNWRMCREICRSMNQNIFCVGYEAREKNCLFYRSVHQFGLTTQGAVSFLTETDADSAQGSGTVVYGVVRSPRRDDPPTRPFVPHLPASADILAALLRMIRTMSNKPWGKHHLSNTACPCDAARIGFPGVVAKCAPGALDLLTRRNFRPGGKGSTNKMLAIKQDACVYQAISVLIKNGDKRLLGKDSMMYNREKMKAYLLKRQKDFSGSGVLQKSVWSTYHSYPIGGCPVAAPECMALIEVANHVGVTNNDSTYSYRKCCVEHMRLAWLVHVANNAFDLLGVQFAVVFGSLVGPMRGGGLLPVFDTDIDMRTSPHDMVLIGHWMEQILVDKKGENLMLLELGPHEKAIREGTRASLAYTSFFYGPHSNAIHVDSHVEFYGQSKAVILKKYGLIDDVTFPPSRICMYGRMVSAPRQPCEFLSMVYGGNPCTTSDTQHMKCDLTDRMFGAWQSECFGGNLKRMHKYKFGGDISSGDGSSRRQYTCSPGQGPSRSEIANRQPGSLQKCQLFCDQFVGCQSIDYVRGSCRLFTTKSGRRPAGSSGRVSCV